MANKFNKGLILLIVLLVVITGCTAQPVQQQQPVKGEVPSTGGRLRIGIIGEVKNLNPFFAETNAEKDLADLMFDGLVRLDKNLKPIPCLAKDWKISDDGLTVVFTLKDELYWHDGEPVTSDDVIFTFDMIFNPDLKISLRDELVNLATYEKMDNSTIKFELFQPDAGFLHTLTLKILPKHQFVMNNDNPQKLDKNVNETQEKRESLNKAISDFNEKPVGTGPYQFVAWDREKDIIQLKVNERYHIKRPYVDYIDLVIYPTYEDAKKAFMEDKVDVIPLKMVDWNLFQEIEDVNTYQFPDTYYEFIALNLKKELFKDKAIRQALMYAINREKIVNETLLGTGRIVNGPIPLSSWVYNHDITSYKYDPERALDILNREGWQDTDGDGILDKDINGDGKREPFKFDILVNEENDIRYQAAVRIQKNLEDIGIKTTITLRKWKEIVRFDIDQRKYDSIILGWDLNSDPDLKYAFHSSQIKSGYNFVGYSNGKVDELVVKARRTMDEMEQRMILLHAQKILNEELPYIFLYTKDKLMASKEKVRGIMPNSNGFFWNIHEWWIPKAYKQTEEHDEQN